MAGHNKHLVTEEDVESILGDFFRHEMPAELRRPEFAHPTRHTAAQSLTDARSGGRAALVGTIVAACSLVLAIAVLIPGNSHKPGARPDNGKALITVNKSLGKSGTNAATTAVAKKTNSVSAFPKPFVPVELQWQDPIMNAFFGDYQLNADDWNRQSDIELWYPHENEKSPPGDK